MIYMGPCVNLKSSLLLYMLVCILLWSFMLVRPTITTSPRSQAISLVANNQQFSLTCKADGVSSYSWEKQDGNISSSATTLNTGNLHFDNLQPWDGGNYRCVAICAFTGYTYSNYSVLTITGTV